MSAQDTSETMMKAVFPALDGFALTSAGAHVEGLDAKRMLDVIAALLADRAAQPQCWRWSPSP
jgi:hypothetical protein